MLHHINVHFFLQFSKNHFTVSLGSRKGTSPCKNEDLFCSVSGECVEPLVRCDGYKDCIDGSDEIGCGNNAKDVEIGSGDGGKG